MEPPNTKFWTTVYPAYLNSTHKKSDGRKLPKSLSVENPTIMEISEVLTFFKLHHALENKAYPRDILERGRVKVRLLDDSSKPINSEIPNSDS
jgi:signal recognition particle subunit SRP19